MLQLVNKVRQAIYKNTFIETNKESEALPASQGSRLIVSVSGGQDSIFLLLTCYLLQNQLCMPRRNRCTHPYRNRVVGAEPPPPGPSTKESFVLNSYASIYKPPFQWLLCTCKSSPIPPSCPEGTCCFATVCFAKYGIQSTNMYNGRKSAHAKTKIRLQNTALQARRLTGFWCSWCSWCSWYSWCEAPSPSPSPLPSPSIYLLSCNHFWQKTSFYVTLHLSKSALVFCLPIVSFIPLNDNACKHTCACVSSRVSLDRKTYDAMPFLPKAQKLRSRQAIQVVGRSPYNRCLGGKARFALISNRARLTKWKQSTGKKGMTEEKARAWRHLVTDRTSTFYNTESCVYGHTQSDRVETTLFNLIRGAGHKGVASLQWERDYSSFSFNKFYPTLKQLQKETHF